jgi:hypothetical protein
MGDLNEAGDDVSRSVQKLRDRMKRSKSGWGQAHLRKLYEGFGFVGRDVGDHTCYYHPRHSHLRGIVPRHRTVRDYVVAGALEAIDELLGMAEGDSLEDGS